MSQMQPPNTRLIAGAMSGTSADGVDVAITRITGRGMQMRADLVHHHHRPYPESLREMIFAVRASGEVKLADLARMGREISLAYALAVNEALAGANLKASDLAAVAAHGQTLFHAPPTTIQWFDPALVAYEVGCPVVSDFRRADLAAGGQGAPLVPFADYVLFRDEHKSRVLLNLGGIANITYLRAGGRFDEVVAFDTGPSNCVSDWICRTHRPTDGGYDAGGDLAGRGIVDDAVVDATLAHRFFARRPPKSTDGPEMIAAFQQAIDRVGEVEAVADLLATACQVTASSVAAEILRLGDVKEVIASGGGTDNRTIMRMLAGLLPGVSVRRLDEIGLRSEAKEALAFALLGAATLDGEPSNVPSVTGAKRGVVLGTITPRP
jgi:anhydro-N-acetylmuramic acid kinase